MGQNVNAIQEAFVGGELSPLLQGRVNVGARRVGCETLSNFIATVQGPVVKRAGTRFVAPAKYDDRDVRLERFEFSADQAYCLEIGHLYMRFHRNEATVLAASQPILGTPTQGNPVQLNVAGHGLSTGQHVYVTGSAMAELNEQFWRVTVVDPNTLDLDDADGTTWSTGTGGTIEPIFELTTTYTDSQVQQIQVDQSNDVLYLAHPDVAPQKLSRVSDTSWTMVDLPQREPAFNLENADESVTVYASAATGAAVTLTASAAIFTANMVGGYVKIRELYASEHNKWGPNAMITQVNISNPPVTTDRIYADGRVYRPTGTWDGAGFLGLTTPTHTDGAFSDGRIEWEYINEGYGYGQIQSIGGGGTTCVIDVDTDGTELPASVVGAAAATHRWAISAWNPEYGYPTAVGFFEDRLFWGGTERFPQTVWGSGPGDYENYAFEGENNEGLFLALNTRRRNVLEWLIGEESLWCGTRGAEFTVDSGNVEQALSRENFLRKKRSSYGSKRGVSPLAVDSYTLFVARAGRRIHELSFSFDLDRFQAKDLTEMSDEILAGGAKGLAQAREPYRMVWVWQEDGSLSAMTYARDQEVVAWHRHPLAGTGSKALSMAVIPHPDGDEDQSWIAVERQVNGTTRKTIEFFEKRWKRSLDIEDAFFVDSGLSLRYTPQTGTGYTQAGQTTVLAAGHGLLAGQQIRIVTDAANTALEGEVFDVTNVTAAGFDIEQGGSPFTDPLTLAATPTFVRVVSTLTRLRHLEGETVAVLVDGAPVDDQVVANGEVTLAEPGAAFVVGLPYVAKVKTMRLEAGGRVGTSQGRLKRWNGLVIRCDQTGPGLFYGDDFEENGGTMDEAFFPNSETLMDTPIPLLDADTEDLSFPGAYERAGAIAIEHRSALPCTVVALMPSGELEERT